MDNEERAALMALGAAEALDAVVEGLDGSLRTAQETGADGVVTELLADLRLVIANRANGFREQVRVVQS